MSWEFGSKEKTDEDSDLELYMGLLGEYIDDEDLMKKIESVHREHWPRYRELLASKSGKYHHWTEQTVPYGLLNHVLRGMWFCEQLSREEAGFAFRGKEAKYKRIVNRRLAAMAVHDMGKMMSTAPSHGVYVHKILKPHGFDSKIRMMAQNHMHQWSRYVAESVGQRIVAYADYCASRPEINVEGVKYIMKVSGEVKVVRTVEAKPIDGVEVVVRY